MDIIFFMLVFFFKLINVYGIVSDEYREMLWDWNRLIKKGNVIRKLGK